MGYVKIIKANLSDIYVCIQTYSTKQIKIINNCESMQTKTKQIQPHSSKTQTIKHNNIWPDVTEFMTRPDLCLNLFQVWLMPYGHNGLSTQNKNLTLHHNGNFEMRWTKPILR